MNYSSAFSPSFAANTFSTTPIEGINYGAAKNFNLDNINFDAANSLNLNPQAYDPGFNVYSSAESWTFITAPGSIEWDLSNEVNRVDMFGTNNAPLISGTRGMRELTLSDCLVEGFARGVTVEGKIAALEKLLDYTLNTEAGYVNVPVYQLWKNQHAYGQTGYFVLKSVKIREHLRDLNGHATRAKVDISMIQVPEYQVGSGRDQASEHFAGSQAKALKQADANLTPGNKAGAAAAAPAAPPKGAKLISTTNNKGVITKRYKLLDGSTYTIKE
jgi:hypothetical protein